MYRIESESLADLAEISALLDLCFGDQLRVRAAQSLRTHNVHDARLSLVARSDAGELIGTVRVWPILLKDLLDGRCQNVMLLGPLGVHPAFRGHKISTALMLEVLERADDLGVERIFLVGDRVLYQPYGFYQTAPCHITLPGGHDADRLMVRQTGRLSALPSVGQLVLPGDVSAVAGLQ